TVGIYLMIMALTSGIAVFLIRESLGALPNPQQEEAAAKIPQPHQIQTRPNAKILLTRCTRSLLEPLVSKRRRPVNLLNSQSIPPRLTKYSVSSKKDKMSSADKANRGGADRILEAAVLLFGQQGLRGTAMKDIATEAG